MQAITSDLSDHFFPLLKSSKEVFLISPFITANIANQIISHSADKRLRLLTRFNLADFKSGVSNLSALQKLAEAGVEIRGLKNLHAKTYIFDNKTVITTSANLTGGGFYSNYEHGVLFSDPSAISATILNSEVLWSYGEAYTTSNYHEWCEILERSPKTKSEDTLPDFGGTFKNEIVDHKTFVKWMGTGSDREALSREIFDLVEGTHCNYAVCFSRAPRRYNDGDYMFVSVMTDRQDYAIIGRARTYRHADNRDVATDSDIGLVGWKKDWPYYIRIYDVEFLDGTLEGCPMLYRHVTNKLDYDSFKSTQERHDSGEENINVKYALRQKQDVRLTDEAAVLLNDEFDRAAAKKGLIPQSKLSTLYNGNHAHGLK